MRAQLGAAALLLAAAWYWRSQQTAQASSSSDDTSPDWTDEMSATMREIRNAVLPTPATDMRASEDLRDMLKRRERVSLARYRLGDGGWTIGYGRYYPDGGQLPPERIDQATADAWFDEDLENRGERWVKAYVSVPLTQQRYDGLTSMAFNLSPKAFRTIADAVNAGDDPEAAAMKFIRAGTNLEHGLRNRRESELALYRSGTYA